MFLIILQTAEEWKQKASESTQIQPTALHSYQKVSFCSTPPKLLMLPSSYATSEQHFCFFRVLQSPFLPWLCTQTPQPGSFSCLSFPLKTQVLHALSTETLIKIQWQIVTIKSNSSAFRIYQRLQFNDALVEILLICKHAKFWGPLCLVTALFAVKPFFLFTTVILTLI